MKKIGMLLLLLSGLHGATFAQEVSARYRGARSLYFLSCLTAETEKVILERRIPAAELSPVVIFTFRVDSTARVSDFRFIEDTSEAEDLSQSVPETEATRKAVLAAFERLGGEWSPATVDGRPVDVTLRMVMRIPVAKIERLQNPDPLLFQGRNPEESFHEWMRERVRYDERFAKVGGLVHVRFWIEPDGRVTIDRIVETPDAKLGKEVVRAIRSSRGKWTPRKVRGVPQRTAYDYRVNYINEGD